MHQVDIQLHRPLSEGYLEEYKYKLLSEGWSYKIVTRVVEHFANVIESYDDLLYYVSKLKNKWNHPFMRSGSDCKKCLICGERLCKHFKVFNGRRSLTIESKNVKHRGELFKSEFSEKKSLKKKKYKTYIMKNIYKVTIEKENPKCLMCKKVQQSLLLSACSFNINDNREEDFHEVKIDEQKDKEHKSIIINEEQSPLNEIMPDIDEMFHFKSFKLFANDNREKKEEDVPCIVDPPLIVPLSLVDSSIVSIKGCEHTYCKVCLEQSLDRQMSLDIFPLKCPCDDCETHIDILEMINLISSASFQKTLWNYHFNKLTNNSNKYIKCSFQDCNGYMDIEEYTVIEEANINENNDNNPPSAEPLINVQNDALIAHKQKLPPKYIHCISFSESQAQIQRNLHSVCYYCRINHDGTISCEEHFKRNLTINVSTCPQCGERFHLDNSVCNYYKCPNCNLDFCGQCMQPLTWGHYWFDWEEGRCQKKQYTYSSYECLKCVIFYTVLVLISLVFPVTALLFIMEKTFQYSLSNKMNFVNRPLYVKYRLIRMMTEIILILVYNVRAYVFVVAGIIGSPLLVIHVISYDCL